MTSLPQSAGTLLVRTDFSDQEGWEALRTAVTTPNQDGFVANVHVVDDPAYRDVTSEQLAALLDPYSLLIVADTFAITAPGQPLLTMRRDGERVEQLRVVADELWSIENNISLANMDWYEFTRAADADGIFRGF
ncbi:DUF6924 domain-containing protein [Prauserella cavernicola]|uniref:DUF6924 domain-containing protein n=1 Tax=Prauserella cavernicola TaxID=2800127 RepID=A0A934QWW9_9PSEU|nr:hypothetical protein [Prauserella cavernicola]MBK1787968.1 hypothetical protein [Prauserella cavernicola]